MPTTSADEHRVGDTVGGRYRLLRPIGRGAMGTVWAARNEAIDRDFALKLLLPESARDPQRLGRFLREAKLAGRLRHKGIVEVYDLGRLEAPTGEGPPYLVMELLVGEPLDALLRRRRVLPVTTTLRIAADLAHALDAAHRAGIVHRDLKPANVFIHRGLDGKAVPKILDFGISKLVDREFDGHETTVGTVVGSPAYMSPEQVAGEPVDARTDLWSLGVIAYRCLTGLFPFTGESFTALAVAIHTKDPVPLGARDPEIPPEVCALVERCLQRRRLERFESALALARALEDALAAATERGMPALDLSGELPHARVDVPADRADHADPADPAGGVGGAPSATVRMGSAAGAPTATHTRAAAVAALTETRVLAATGDVRPQPAAPDRDPTSRLHDDAQETLTADGARAHPPPHPRRRRLVVGALAVIAFAGLAFALRTTARSTTEATATTMAAHDHEARTTPSASAPPAATVPTAPPESAASPATTTSGSTVAAATSIPTAAPSPKGSKGSKAKSAWTAKGSPPAVAAPPTAAPHDGLVHPGF